MAMTETQLKIKVLRMIKEEFPDVWCYKTNDLTHSGIPDLLMCQGGHLRAVELKRPGYNYTFSKGWPLQRYFLNRINASGGKAIVARSVEEVRNFLKGGETK